MGHGGLEANHRNLLPFGSSSSPAPGPQAAQGSLRLLSLTDSHCSLASLGDPFLAQDESGASLSEPMIQGSKAAAGKC